MGGSCELTTSQGSDCCSDQFDVTRRAVQRASHFKKSVEGRARGCELTTSQEFHGTVLTCSPTSLQLEGESVVSLALSGPSSNGSEREGPIYRSGPTRCRPEGCVWLVSPVIRRAPGRRKFVGRLVAEARMWAHPVVVEAPGFDDGARLGERSEHLLVQAFVAQLAS